MACMQSFIIGQRVWLTDYSGSGFITQDREVNQWSEMPNESSLLRSCFVELEFEGVAAWIKEIRRKIRHESKAPIIFFPAISPLNCLHFPAALGQILVIRLHCKIPQRERLWVIWCVVHSVGKYLLKISLLYFKMTTVHCTNNFKHTMYA